MGQTELLYASFLLVGVFISAISQVMLKKSAMRTYESRIKEYMNPLVIMAYVFFVGTTFLSILSYKVIPISMGPILESTSYIYVTAFGVKLFGEKLNKKKVMALMLIVCGIIVFSTS